MSHFLRALTLALTLVAANVTAFFVHSAPVAVKAPAVSADTHRSLDRLRVDEHTIAVAEAPPPAPPAPPPAPVVEAVYHPVPVAPPPAPVHYSGTIPQIIQNAFAPLGSGAVQWAERVAQCESGDNPNATNPAGYYGLFQFSASTWSHTPYAGRSWYDASANANAAAWLYSRSGAAPWGCR